VSKAVGLPLAKAAARIMSGKTLAQLGIKEPARPSHISVKESVFPFIKFPGVDTILGPEMKSTGEVMGIDRDFGTAFFKSQLAAGQVLPSKGRVFISVRDADKPLIIETARRLVALGFSIIATKGTAAYFREKGLAVEEVLKVAEGRPHIVDRMLSGDIALVINTTQGAQSVADSYSMRRTALVRAIPYQTTLAAARAAVAAIQATRGLSFGVRPLQEYHSAAR
ncbi:MAG: carbamoyl phosphate synthase large subunit, partial [Bdellovibrionota bacterium]